MNSLRVVLLVVGLCYCREQGQTPHGDLEPMNYMDHVAGYGDAAHRGPAWYSMDSQEYKSSKIEDSDSETSVYSSDSLLDDSSEASSKETSERKKATRVYRTCTPCPHDMLKKYTNKGIKWICGGYQRARRTFKSECMMRFRNCQDGTMFIKMYDHRCKDDEYHGRHWFYIYKV